MGYKELTLIKHYCCHLRIKKLNYVYFSDLSWVTLATNDSYSLGALVLAHSLKRVGTQHQLVVMVTPGVTAPMR